MPRQLTQWPWSNACCHTSMHTNSRMQGANARMHLLVCPRKCTHACMQGTTGCAANTWRFQPDGYLREVLTARVYDVAVGGLPVVQSCAFLLHLLLLLLREVV